MVATRRLPLVVLLVAVFAVVVSLARPSSAQELVLQKEGSREYHRPACPLVRDTKQVLAMSRAQAEGRGLKPHADCDPSRTGPPSGAGSETRATPRAPATVVVSASSNYYHRAGCARIGNNPKELALEEAGKRYWPCRTCKPPIRKRKP